MKCMLRNADTACDSTPAHQKQRILNLNFHKEYLTWHDSVYSTTHWRLVYELESPELQTLRRNLKRNQNNNQELVLNTQIQIQPLFTLGSVCSTSASGAEQTIETNNSNIT